MQQLHKRTVLKLINKALNGPDILILLGSRQVGKTSILRLLREQIQNKEPERKIIWLDAEDSLIREKLNNLNLSSIPPWLSASGLSSGENVCLFIDEVQYLDKPASLLKIIHDHFPNIKCIVSGSSTLEIKNKLQDSLMGRKQIFHIDTLTLAEYLEFQHKAFPELLNLSLPQILDIWTEASSVIKEAHDNLYPLWQNFIVSGGFPKIALAPNWEDIAKNLIELRTTFISRDIPEYYRYLDGRALSNLIVLLAEQTGSLFNEAELSNTLGISKTTVARYVWLLEQTFAVFRLTPFFTNKRSELSKMPKIYFHDTGWRNIWLQPTLTQLSERADAGHLVENGTIIGIHKKLILNELNNFFDMRYWRTTNQQEVDLILQPLESGKTAIPVEIKYQSSAKFLVPSAIKSFFKKYPNTKRAVVITKENISKQNYDGKEIFFLPAWALS